MKLKHRSSLGAIVVACSLSLPCGVLAESPSSSHASKQLSAHPENDAKIKAASIRLTAESIEVRKAAVSELSDIDDSRTLTLMISALADDEAEVRMSAAMELGKKKGASKAVQPLADTILIDEDEGVRYWSAKTLGSIGDAKAVDALCIALRKDKDKNVRLACAESLGNIKDQKAIKALSELLKLEKDSDVRLAAVAALGDIGGQLAKAALKTVAAKDTDEWVRKRAQTAIEYIDSR